MITSNHAVEEFISSFLGPARAAMVPGNGARRVTVTGTKHGQSVFYFPCQPFDFPNPKC